MLAHSGLITHYTADREGADRVENLEELMNAAQSFVSLENFGREAPGQPLDEQGQALTQSPASQGLDFSQPMQEELAPDAEDTGETLSPLAAFLSHAALEAGDNQAQAGQDAIQLMTVHASKGLEFDCVFITGIEESLFPHENSMSDHEGLEEERRLMYVAITRARKRLYLSHSQTRMLHGQTRYNMKSRFYDELPESALKWITPKQPGLLPNRGGFNRSSDTLGPDYAKLTATPPTPMQKAAPAHGLRANMKVFHAKFGEGTVVTLEGVGDDARAQINFPRHGVKWLALSVAKLTPLP
jgi:DNA helicase-2/ATP-dependent DNA helicase PcrA